MIRPRLRRLASGRKLATAALLTVTVFAALAATAAAGATKHSSAVGAATSSKDTCGYDPTAAPKPGGGTVQFDENSVTRAIAFYGTGTAGHVGVFANDESGLLIGAGGTPSSSVSGQDYGEAVPPTFGSGVDLEGRAVAPEIYLTDVTANSAANGGDYEQGGTAANAGPPPFANALYGSWSPTVGTKPVNKNNWDLGPHADAIPATDAFGGTTTSFNEGYGAEVVWNVGGLKAFDPATSSYTGLLPGHTYRAQSITHDTDQNHTSGGGDVGEVCTTFSVPRAPQVDLAITKSASPTTIILGQGNITWTMVVKNNGPDADTGVKVTDPLPAGTTFVSVSTTKGTCAFSGGVITCNIGNMAAGESVTITLVTTPTRTGEIDNNVTVVGDVPEVTTNNNSAAASAVVSSATPPPVACVAVSRVAPKQLFVGRKTTVTIHVTRSGKAVQGIRVLIKGPKLKVITGRSNSKGMIKQQVKLGKAGVVIFTPLASKACNTKRVGVTGVFTPPVTG